MEQFVTSRFQLAVLGAVINLSVTGCSYSVLLIARTAGNEAPRIGEPEIQRASATISDIAREFGLDPSATLARSQEVGAEESHRVLGVYGRDADLKDDWSKVLLVAYVDEEGQFVVLLRDWSSIRETQFMQSLRQRVISGLNAALPQHQIEVRRLHDMPAFYVP